MAVNVNVWNLMYSMRSVSRWQDTIQSNINGALRNGYKEADLVFGGNATYDAISPTQTMLGKQIGEQAISVASTRNLWGQGDLIATKSLTDYAIRGEGFFMVHDPKDNKVYYTRDGSFRPDDSGKLINAEGLVLVDVDLATTLGLPFTPPTPAPQPNDILLANLSRKDELRYSKYGSTIFEAFFPVTANDIGLPETGDRGNILQQYLEASNVNVEKQMVALTQSNKLQEAITKQFLVFYSNIDVGINLIK